MLVYVKQKLDAVVFVYVQAIYPLWATQTSIPSLTRPLARSHEDIAESIMYKSNELDIRHTKPTVPSLFVKDNNFSLFDVSWYLRSPIASLAPCS